MILRKIATLTELSAKHAVLSLENGQQLSCLREELEPGLVEGMQFVVQIIPEAEAKLEQEALARTLLNQLLSDDEGHS